MTDTENQLIYKVCTLAEWQSARALGAFEGSAADRADGFVHFSAAHQLRETVARHFAGIRGLVLVEVKTEALGKMLKWQPSRGGDLFPHLFKPMPLEAVTREWSLPLGMDGNHQFPVELETYGA